MKKALFTISIILCLLSCETSKEINLQSLNGYWEIEKVIAPNGEKKEYKFSSFIDLVKIKTDSSGYKTKLKPNFTGTYEGNNIKQHFQVTHKKDIYFINYKVANNKWSEILIEATPNKFITKNNEGVLYIYKPFTPITVK